jgi:hypothetical protein
MTGLKNVLLAAAAVVINASASFAAGQSTARTADPITAISDDYSRGSLTLDQKALLQITAIKHPKDLPARYQLFDAATGRSGARTATIAIKEIKQSWDQLSSSTQATVSQALTRWPTAYTYDSRGGFFKLHYDITGGNAVPAADSDADGIPDYVEKCAAYCDTSYAVQMALGYLPPPSDGGLGGDARYDVYFEEMPYYGYSVPEGPGPAPWNDYYSYLVLHRNFQGFPANTDPEGRVAGAAKATAAHEFHHSIQFAYNAGADSWFMEADATYMEDIVFDKVNDNYNYLPWFMNDPEISLMANTDHMYSCFVWPMFLAEKFDTSLMVAVWQGARYSPIFNAMSDSLQGRYGWTQDSAFAEFVTWNFFTSSRNDHQHFQDAADYPLVMIDRTHSSYPTGAMASPKAPAGYGSCYVQFQPGANTGTLRVVFDGDDSRQWAAWLIKTPLIGTSTVQKFTLNAPAYLDTLEVPDFQNYSSVTLVGANLAEFSTAASFAYSAEIRPSYALSSTMLTDSAVYSGATRQYQYRVNNTSGLSDAVDIAYYDSLGWIVPDTVLRLMPAGTNTTVDVLVSIPQNTPLGTISHLHFRAVSHGDTSVATIRDQNAATVVQRGDVNFDGVKDIGDLTVLVDYLFASGPPPQPVLEAGNFDCIGSVDIGDLTSLVDYLFVSGPPPPCNPY